MVLVYSDPKKKIPLSPNISIRIFDENALKVKVQPKYFARTEKDLILNK